MAKTFLAPKHACARIDRCRERLAQLEAEGKLTAIRDSLGRRFYDADEIERFLAAREAQRREREQQAHAHVEPRPAA